MHSSKCNLSRNIKILLNLCMGESFRSNPYIKKKSIQNDIEKNIVNNNGNTYMTTYLRTCNNIDCD